MASRAWWVMLVVIGPLVGVSFISAVTVVRRAERPERHRCRRRRSVLAAGRHLGADVQRVRAGRRVPAAVRRHSPRLRRPPERRAEDRDAASAVAVRAHLDQGAVLMAAWLVASLAPLVGRRVVDELWRQRLRAGVGHGDRRPSAECRPDDRARGGRRRGHRAPVDRRDPHAQRHGRHVDRQLRRRGSRRLVGAGRRLHADGDGGGVSTRPGAARRHPRRDRADRCRPRLSPRSGCGSASPVRRRAADRSALAAVPRRRSSRLGARHAELGRLREPRELVLAKRTKRRCDDHGAAAHRGAPRAGGSAARRSRAQALAQAAARDAGRAASTTCRRRRSACSSRPRRHYGEIWYELERPPRR